PQQQQEPSPPPPFYQSSSTLDFTGTAEQLQSLSNCYTLLHEASNSRSATSSSTSNDNMQRRRSNSRRYAQHRQMIPSPPPLQPSASAFASEMPHHGSTASHLGYQQQQQGSNAPMLAALMAANAQSNLLNPSPLDHQPPPPAHQQPQQHQRRQPGVPTALQNAATANGGLKRSGDFSFPTFDSSSAQSVSSSIFGGAASIVDEFLSGCSSSSFSHHNHHHQHHHHHHHHSSPSSARPDSVLPEELPFFEHLNTLLKPTLLRPSRSNGHNQYQQQAHCDLEFGMNPQQVKSVLSMRTRDLASGRTEYAVQVLIRCFHSEAGTQPDAFPPGVNLTVNSQPVLGLPAPLPCRPGSDPVRPGRPVNISGLCRLSASSQANNRIRVSWLHRPSGPGYCLSVSLARVVSSNDLANRLLTLPGRVRPASQTQRQIRQLLLGNGDDDEDDDDAMVAMTTITASLRCPLSCARIQLPVRSDDCRHVQCFDARTYLSMNERRATWRCPCCDRPAPYASLHVDAHFQSVLANAPKSVDVVRFLDDGTWQPAGANAASSSTSASTAASASTYKGSSSALGGANFDSVVIDDDDDDDNSYSAIDEAPPTLKRQKRSDSVDDSPSTICNDLDPGDVIVVDLTADSDSGGDGNGRDCDDSSDSQSDTDTYNNGYGFAYFSGAVGVIVTPVQSPSPSPPIQPSSHGGGASSSSNSSSSAAAAAPLSYFAYTLVGDAPAASATPNGGSFIVVISCCNVSV
uniref:SP-RING-type domain-containing protein n=1 Tax=Macrostomum lignano TaxID=282301 RepID=A0A1I8H8Q9_9PLAT